jgi:hypothetical protein
MQDTNGNFYSYGYHYPLLFKVDGVVFRNVRGYSSTTARHIHWTRDIEAIDVELSRDDRLNYLNLNTLNSRLHEQRDGIVKQMVAKKRKNTQVYKGLFRELLRVDQNLNRLQEARL